MPQTTLPPRHTWLDQQLDRFTPADDVEALHLRRMRDLLSQTHDPFARSHFSPGHFTASAFVLSPDRRSLLLILHAKLHRWLQPGGHVDPQDTDLIAAAQREALEETCIANLVHLAAPCAIFDLDIHPIPASLKKNEPAHEHFDVRFLFQAPTLQFTAASDAMQAKWVELHTITQSQTDASVMRAIQKLR